MLGVSIRMSSAPENLSRFAGEVETRSGEGEGDREARGLLRAALNQG
jgi:hypothetical protein